MRGGEGTDIFSFADQMVFVSSIHAVVFVIQKQPQAVCEWVGLCCSPVNHVHKARGRLFADPV